MKYIKSYEKISEIFIVNKIFIANIENNKFQLYLGNILVAESGFNIENKDKWFNEKYAIIHDLETIKKFRRKGFAKYLLEEIFNYVKK